jgi:hypothetical protein
MLLSGSTFKGFKAVPSGRMIGTSNALHVSRIVELTEAQTRPLGVLPGSQTSVLFKSITFRCMLRKRQYSFVLRTETETRANSASCCCGHYLRHWTCLKFICSGELAFVLWWILVAESFLNFMYVYFAPPDICSVGSQAVSVSVCSGGFIRLLRLDPLHWWTGRLLRVTVADCYHFYWSSKLFLKYFDTFSLLLLSFGRLLVKFYIIGGPLDNFFYLFLPLQMEGKKGDQNITYVLTNMHPPPVGGNFKYESGHAIKPRLI